MRLFETDINDIAFEGTSPGSVESQAGLMWGNVTGSCLVSVNGKMFINDGIDPTTGQPFTDEVIEAIKAKVEWLAVIK